MTQMPYAGSVFPLFLRASFRTINAVSDYIKRGKRGEARLITKLTGSLTGPNSGEEHGNDSEDRTLVARARRAGHRTDRGAGRRRCTSRAGAHAGAAVDGCVGRDPAVGR